MPISLSAIRDLLLPGVRKISGDYAQIKTQWASVFKQGKSSMAVERTVEMRFLSIAELKQEGGQTAFDSSSGQRYVYNQEHVEIGLGYVVTRKAIDDNQYKAQFKPSNLGLNKSFAQAKEILHADVLNTATTYNTQVGGDGKALVATDHPIDGSTVANRPSTDVSLNENGIYSQLILIRKFKDNAGLKILAMGDQLIIPRDLEYDGARLTKTELRPGTANNDVNALLHASGLPGGTMIMDFLTSATSWFIKTDQPEGLSALQRINYESDMHTDFTTDNLLVKGYERYNAGYDGWRGIAGSFPS